MANDVNATPPAEIAVHPVESLTVTTTRCPPPSVSMTPYETAETTGTKPELKIAENIAQEKREKLIMEENDAKIYALSNEGVDNFLNDFAKDQQVKYAIEDEAKRIKCDKFFKTMVFYTMVICGFCAWMGTMIFVLVSDKFQ